MRVFHKSVSVFILPWKGGRIPGIGPISVVRDRPIPNGSRSGDLDLQGGGLPAKRMARETRSHARVACEGPSPTMKGKRYFYRSAGACPPRSVECADDGEGQALALREGEAFFSPQRGAVPATLSDL